MECARTRRDNNGACFPAIFVLCFITNEGEIDMDCISTDSTPSPTSSPLPGVTTTPSTLTTSSMQSTDSTFPTFFFLDESKGFFQPPTLFYFIGGLFATIALLLVAVIVVTIALYCFFERSRDTLYKNQENREADHAPNTQDAEETSVHFYDDMMDMSHDRQPQVLLSPLNDSQCPAHALNSQEQQPRPLHAICAMNPCYSVLESQDCSTNIAYAIFEGEDIGQLHPVESII